MTKTLAIALVALCTATMLSSCATHEPAASATSQSAKKKQQGTGQNVGVGAETANDPGRSDPSGANTGAGLQTDPSPLNEPGRADNQ